MVVYHSDAAQDDSKKVRDQWAELQSVPIPSKRLYIDFKKEESCAAAEDVQAGGANKNADGSNNDGDAEQWGQEKKDGGS